LISNLGQVLVAVKMADEVTRVRVKVAVDEGSAEDEVRLG
jgi:hypothetical protein